jgi:hypothetical protein
MSLKRIILHVGTGKTGSSSIQRALALSHKDLETKGYAYLGRTLETYRNEQSLPIEPWQRSCILGECLSLGDKGIESFINRLNQQLDQLEERGIQTAIISNEGYINRAILMQPVINAMASREISVEVVAVVRRHYEWAFSAYLQWGIKHKIKPGRILAFGEWIKKHPPRFAESLNNWRECEGVSKFRLLNYSSHPDIVSGFFDELGIQLDNRDLSEDRSNRSITELEAIILATYGDHQEGKSHPNALRGLLKRLDQQSHTFRTEAIQSWPDVTDQELKALIELCEPDLEATNKLLVEYNQPKLQSRTEEPLQIPSSISRHKLSPRRQQEELVAALLCVVTDMDQQLRKQDISITQLRREIKKLQNHR